MTILLQGGGLQAVGSGIVLPTPIARYRFDEGAGATIADMYGGPSLTQTGGVWGPDYLSIDGNTGVAEFTSPNGTWYDIGNTHFSVGLWFNPNDVSGTATQTLWMIGSGAGATTGAITMTVSYDNNGDRFRVNCISAGNVQKVSDLSFTLSAGTNYLYMITYNKSTDDNCTLTQYVCPEGSPGSIASAVDSTQKLLKQVATHELHSKTILGGTGGYDCRYKDMPRYNTVFSQAEFLGLLARGSEAA